MFCLRKTGNFKTRLPVDLEKNKKFPMSQIELATRGKKTFVDASFGFRAMMPNVRCSFKKKLPNHPLAFKK
jgi:hypothetical protein